MSPAFEIPDDQREPLVGFRLSWFRLGHGARSALGRSMTVECTVWAMLVVPGREQRHLFADRGEAKRDGDPACPLALERSEETFDHGDASHLANRSESLSDASLSTPTSKRLRRELLPAIGDEVLWRNILDLRGLICKHYLNHRFII